MSVFRRRRGKQEPEQGGEQDLEQEALEPDLEDDPEALDEDGDDAAEREPAVLQAPQGPWDVDDVPDDDVPRIDLGGMRVPVPDDTEVRIDVSPEGEVVAATLAQGPATLQVNVFAAPRTEGIWSEVAAEISSALSESGGIVETVRGEHGVELRAAVPTEVQGQGIVLAPVRFVGVDGPRWFLRAVLTGTAAIDPRAAAPLLAALRDVVVVRGAEAMAVRDPIPLRLPPEAQGGMQPGVAADDPDRPNDLSLPERGPEITEIQ